MKLTGILSAMTVLALAVTACGTSSGGGGGGGTSSKKIALLLPETKTARYESKDRPLFEAKVKALCSDCQIIYSNANQDAAAQQSQAEAALTNGAKVLVLDAVDGAAAAAIANKAKQSNVPVISYDQLILNTPNVNFYISFDNQAVGKLQGMSLLQALGSKANPSIVMINGAPTDNNAKLFKQGAHSVLDGKVEIVKEDAAANWKPEEAQQLMEQFIAAVGKDGFDGAYCANDGTAGGAIAAMKTAGIDPKTRPITGQDAEVAAVQRILSGEQYMTVYKAIQPEAEKTAELACGLFKGEKPAAESKVNNGTIDVPSVLLTPIAVTATGSGTTKSVADTIVKDKFYGPDTVAKICKGFEPVCQAASIK